MTKFAAGSNYAMKAMKRQIMARASRLVIESHKKVLSAFQTEALCLLHQVLEFKEQMQDKEKKAEEVLRMNYTQEVDLAMVLNQQSYVEERLPK